MKKKLVKYEPRALPGKVTTNWICTTLPNGAEVAVGLQQDHPHGGPSLTHDLRKTQPDTGERTQLKFSLSVEAARALVSLYVAHGILATKKGGG